MALGVDPNHGRNQQGRDPLRHPDLERLARQLRDQYDEVLEAEQHAALAASRRILTLRQRLIQAEDSGEVVVAYCTDGQLYRGILESVGADHMVLADSGRTRYLVLDQIVGIEFQ